LGEGEPRERRGEALTHAEKGFGSAARAGAPQRTSGCDIRSRGGSARDGPPGVDAVCRRVGLIHVELLYFDGCPNHEAMLPHLRELLADAAVDAEIELVRVEDPAAAERERFLGSPSVRVDGEDIDPTAAQRTDYGLQCRLFATSEGLRGVPPDEWLLAALDRASARGA
jgi:hypothetical protein